MPGNNPGKVWFFFFDIAKKAVCLQYNFATASLRIPRIRSAEAKCETVTYVNVKMKVD
jgi:hypothetical protein